MAWNLVSVTKVLAITTLLHSTCEFCESIVKCLSVPVEFLLVTAAFEELRLVPVTSLLIQYWLKNWMKPSGLFLYITGSEYCCKDRIKEFMEIFILNFKSQYTSRYCCWDDQVQTIESKVHLKRWGSTY